MTQNPVHTTTITKDAVETMPREAPVAKLPIVVPMGMLQPLDTLPSYLRCDTRSELDAIIEDLIAGGMVPKSFLDPSGAPDKAKLRVAIMNGREIGYGPLFAIQHQYVVNGIPSWFGDVPLGRCYVSGLVEDFEERFEIGDLDDKGLPSNPKAICRTKRRGIKTETVREFSWKDVMSAGLDRKEGPWQGYYKRMMQFRARGFALRDAYADVLMGMRIAEEHFTATHWEQAGGSGTIIDVETDKPIPPRPTRPVEDAPAGQAAPPAPEQKIETGPAAPTLYPAIDCFGNPAGEYASGDWLDKAGNYLERIEKGHHQVLTWFEHNGETLDELGKILSSKDIAWFLELRKEAAAAVFKMEAEAAAASLDRRIAEPSPTPSAPTPPAPTPTPAAAPKPAPQAPLHTSAPAPTGRIDLRNWRGEVKHVGNAPGDYGKAVSWVMKLHQDLGEADRRALVEHNITWLIDANKSGALSDQARAILLPPEPAPAAKAVIPDTPPPPAPAPAPAAEEKQKRTRKPKESAAPGPESLDEKFALIVVPYSFDVERHTEYYVAMNKEVIRLKEAKAPPEAFSRFRELNAANITTYRGASKTWCLQLERIIEKLIAPSPLAQDATRSG
jgi:hypothetical protein